MADVDLSDISEIIIQPDGRVFIFGMTRSLLELVESLPTKDVKIKQRREFLQKVHTKHAATRTHRKSEV